MIKPSGGCYIVLRIFSLIFVGLFLCLSGHAEQVCVKDGTYIGLLKKNTNVSSNDDITYSSANKEWKISFDYKTITGIASCRDNPNNKTFGTKDESLSGTTAPTGQHCWCKMEPVANYNHYTGIASFWVYLKNYSSNTDCADDNGCAKTCAYAIAYNYDSNMAALAQNNTNGFRHKFFDTIGTSITSQNNNGCASGYANLVNVSASSFADLNGNSECNSGYHTYDVNASCRDGYKWVNSDCVKLCEHSNSETIMLSGQTVTLYGTPITEKYLTVLFGGTNKCYVGMGSGASSTDGVNIIIGNGGNNNTYHTIN